MGKPDHQDIPVPRAIIIATYLMLCAAFILLLCPIDTVAWLGLEDGPIENAGALSFLLAGAVFLVTAYRSSGLHRQYGTNHIESSLALLALGALCLVCFGEEISWGQRLFDYSVPAWLADINRQGEWNLHNLAWFHAQTAEGAEKSFWARLINMDRLLAFFQLTLCTLVPPISSSHRRSTRSLASNRSWAGRSTKPRKACGPLSFSWSPPGRTDGPPPHHPYQRANGNMIRSDHKSRLRVLRRFGSPMGPFTSPKFTGMRRRG
jgi:hypothetical protein